ncbi:MAG: hypothetical protein ABI456_23645, partial [Ktedonobacteraceae bacterium]
VVTYIESNAEVHQELENDFRKYWKYRKSLQRTTFLKHKTPLQARPIVNPASNSAPNDFFEIHPEKIADSLHGLMELFLSDGWYRVDENFKNFYMTLLATHVSRRCRAGLLTDRTVYSQLSNTIKLDAQFSSPIVRGHFTSDSEASSLNHLAQGVLVSLALEGIQIHSNTPVEQILKFRERHNSELGRFRRKIAELAEIISSTESDSLEAFLQCIQDTYINEVSPEVSSLKEELNHTGIKWRIGELLTLVLPVVASPFLNSIGVPLPVSSGVSAGGVATAFIAKYNIEKYKLLKENSFSYLLKSRKEFHYKGIHRDSTKLRIPPPLLNITL